MRRRREDARQQAAQMAEGDGAIDAPRRPGREVLLGGQIRGQGVEVVADHLGAGVLAGGEPSEARGVFEVQAMLNAFERLLDPPALMVEIGKGRRRIALGVEQGRHEYAHLARRRHLANQTHRRRLARAFIIDGVAAIGRRQGHHRFVQARAHELGDGGEGRRRIAAHAERNAAVQQGRDQPGARITAIEHQHIVGAQPVQTLEQHLPLADLRAVQDQRIKQLGAGAKQTEQRRLTDTTSSLRVEQRQANLRRIGGQYLQAQPARGFGQVRIDEAQQLVIEQIEDIRSQMAARLRECAGGHYPGQADSPGQHGEERIEFNLNRTADAGEQKGDQRLKGQIALACEIPGITPGGVEEDRALNEGGEAVKYVDIFRPSYLTYKYQSVTAHILTHPRLSKDLTQEYAEMLSHEDWVADNAAEYPASFSQAMFCLARCNQQRPALSLFDRELLVRYLAAQTSAGPAAMVLRAYRRRFEAVAHERAYLRETLSALLSGNLDAGRSAEQLGIHRNSLAYRQQRIRDELDLDPVNRIADVLLSYVLLEQ